MNDLIGRVRAGLATEYRIERELGRGGAAIVYLAEDLKHERQVAVKVMRPDLAATLGTDRFLRETKIAAQLSHPHILPVHDSGELGGFLYYVMPVVHGESLRGKLGRLHRLSVPETVSLLHDVLDALHYAHDRGVVHRDIKPDNVMLSGRHALVTDFGVAKAVTAAAEPAGADTRGVALGTPAYMAPEQAGADPSIDHRADLYSLGAMAYEMLAGRPPFQDESPQRLLTAQVTQAPRPITDLRSGIPAELAQLVMRLLQKQPADRYQTAQEVLEALGTGSTPESGSNPVVSTLSLSSVGRKRAIWSALTLVVLLVGALVWGRLLTGSTAGGALERPVLAVLPFDNLGPTDDLFFSHGIASAITARLGALGNLGVISRSSANQYEGSPKSAKEIGEELGVDYILEGTIQRERPGDPTSRLRITPQLVRVSDARQLWASIYDEDMTEVFVVQSDIAERVARALDIAILLPDRTTLAASPTTSLEAYESYLRGHDYLEENRGSGNANARRIAVDLLQNAIDLDGKFALAYAELSVAHMWLYRWFVDRTEERAAMARAAADSAMALQPELPQAHLALAHYFNWKADPDPDRALQQFREVVRRDPNNAYVRTLMAELQAAQGNWNEALENAALAVELDPLEPEWAAAAATYHLMARDYLAADEYVDRALGLASDLVSAHRDHIALSLRWRGDTTGARQAGDQMLETVTPGEVALALIDVAPALVASGQYDSLFEELTPGSLSGPFLFDYYLARGEYFRLRGRKNEAASAYDSLLAELDRAPAERRESPAMDLLRARALAGANRRKEARESAHRVETALTGPPDAYETVEMGRSLVNLFIQLGDYDAALDRLEGLLSVPSLVSVPLLRVEPFPAEFRALARFQRMLAGPT